ncbi:hypothetical protein HG535_0E01440 [Zygotorulaspora mrakii]|uniref:Pre-rRNA-processing protein RIX1 n=1 Tax=Zygotorulaspora mrakii TaxID=42260 RepID=A0A7H9B358_ZYGMR|nr:uncharacterized protein HG535_0E01440 [Zygotorulaspora mrakii]QLG73060.1 hypothetical protein HG535_0E01440 [Zygotorulaspora mrakii]
MNTDTFPVTVIAKQLESATASEFQTLLNLLRSPDYINEKLLKSELALLITKTLALLRSSDDEKLWRGCHVSVVICSFNPLVLCSHSGQLLAAIYSKLEQKVEYYASTINTPYGTFLFETLVFAISSLWELMRDKPTLSRESLTPKLKAIIPTLISLAQYQPKFCLPLLKKLLYRSTTTFKPFASRFRQLLITKLSKGYAQYDRETQILLCENYAYLHLIRINPAQTQDEALAHHKAYLDENWRIGLFSVLSQFKPIIELCEEILQVDQDGDLKALINSLNFDSYYKEEERNEHNSLPGLKLDMNEPLTLCELPKRLNLLVDLSSAFITSSTPYAVRIPFGICINISEALLSMTRNYLPLRRDLRRDGQLTSIINTTIPQIQFCGVRFLSNICEVYAKNFLSMIPSVLSSLELFIPLKAKSTIVDLEKCSLLRKEFLQVFQLLNTLFPHMGHHFQEIDLITKLLDVALHLSEDLVLIDTFFKQQSIDKIANQPGMKKRQKKENTPGALSDLYTHSDKFNIKNIQLWHDEINFFLRSVLSNWKLPSHQQIKILKHSVCRSLKLKEQLGYIPKSFVELLRTEVLYPGNERVSVLPIAVSLMKGATDDVFDLLCHPRLPMGIIHSVNKPIAHTEESFENVSEGKYGEPFAEPQEVADESETIRGDEQLEDPPVSSKTEDPKVFIKPENVVQSKEHLTNIHETLILKKRSVDQGIDEVQIVKRLKTEEIVPKNETVAAKEELNPHASEEEDSEFEIPAIQLSDDDEEEDNEEEDDDDDEDGDDNENDNKVEDQNKD